MPDPKPSPCRIMECCAKANGTEARMAARAMAPAAMRMRFFMIGAPFLPFSSCRWVRPLKPNVEAAPSIIATNPMTPRPIVTFMLALAGALPAGAQTLVCPPSPAIASRSCEAFHYHVALYRPDTRAFAELYGINQFASQSACDRARDAAMKRNESVVAALRPKDNQYQVDRFGPCHCDLSIDKSSPNYLTDLQRIGQV